MFLSYKDVMSRVGVTYKAGFELDNWIYFILYIHNSGLEVKRELSLFYTLSVHRCTRLTVVS
jgi:hypothetical protein